MSRALMAGQRAALKKCSLFTTLSEPELALLSRSSSIIAASQGQVFFSQDEAGDDFFVIVSGSVRISTRTTGPSEQAIALLGPDSSFGEMSFLDGEPRSATAVAVSPVTAVRIDRTGLERLYGSAHAARRKILERGVHLLSSRLRTANTTYWELAQRSLRERLESARSRSQLLALFSHELRTPLTVIRSAAQILLRAARQPHRRFLDKIITACDHLNTVVQDLITLSTLQGTEGPIEVSLLDSVAVARDVLRRLAPVAEAKNIELSLETPEERLPVLADARLLARALHHLVDNAIKFSPANTKVVLEAAATDQSIVRLTVIDEGEGVPRHLINRLFETFSQAQDPLTRDAEGLGIGLPFANEVMRAHGGHLIVDSAPGRGSRFTLHLSATPTLRAA